MIGAMQVRAPFRAVAPPLDARMTDDAWRLTPVQAIAHDWRGRPGPLDLVTEARACWTTGHLWFGFECRYSELDIDTGVIDTSVERVGLWDRDVCEAFVWHPGEPHAGSYKEFEVAPTGQWCDLTIRQPRVDVDWRWNSGMETAAAIDEAARVWRAVMRVPFSAFSGPPEPGDVWRVNLFRIGRERGERCYLSYAPTGTSTPDFHVPACFVPLVFEP